MRALTIIGWLIEHGFMSAPICMIIGHLPRFMILNELNTKKFSHFSDCVEKLDIKCGGAEKIRRRLNRSVDDFNSMEIWLGKSAKFDGAGVYISALKSDIW